VLYDIYLTPSMIHRMFLVINFPRGDSWNRKLQRNAVEG
jgi:hypothetical protein